ncbi:MAG: CsgG/HfaB family protein [Kiritimatiellae bacterium]|nr:CsgG/HfaB family protein [Kiritimatiellia bacterium]MDW8459514.1 hypothetical protein [Verrucomicrobiota bacterium]
MNFRKFLIWSAVFTLFFAVARAEEQTQPAPAQAPIESGDGKAGNLPLSTKPDSKPPAENTAPLKIAVIVPERVDGEWFWYYWGGGNQHIVQSAIEKALVREGYHVVDVTALGSWRNLDDLIGARTASEKGRELGADLVIAGKATAVSASHSFAYGLPVVRANAEITVRLVRTSDGKVLAVEDASAQAGGQSSRAAGQDALKQAASAISRNITSALRNYAAP